MAQTELKLFQAVSETGNPVDSTDMTRTVSHQSNPVALCFINESEQRKAEIIPNIRELSKAKSHAQHLTGSNHQQVYEQMSKKVLILYASGSMGLNYQGQIQKGRVRECLRNNLFLCNYKKTVDVVAAEVDQEYLASPSQANGATIVYKVKELPHIRSSIYSNIQHCRQIAEIIKNEYFSYDSFIILTGFDVICYVASAVSFMLQNLQKLVIFSGGYLPLTQMRNDSVNNIVEAFAIIAQAPPMFEVLIVSKNKGFRANRATKLHEGVTDSLQSPNLAPLVEVNIRISFNQHLFISRPKTEFSLFTDFSNAVKLIRYHPYIDKESLQYQIANPHIKGFIIESYGAANLPDNKEILQTFKQAHQKHGKIFINISQTIFAINRSIMAPYLKKFCIIFGGDMTVQTALAKFSYLIGKGYSSSEIEDLMKQSLRGQVTLDKAKQQFQLLDSGFMDLVEDVMEDYFPTDKQETFQHELIDSLSRYCSPTFTPQQFVGVFKPRKPNQNGETGISSVGYVIQNTFTLHYAVKHKNIDLINFLLKNGANPNKEDDHVSSPCFYALEMKQKTIIKILLSYGGRVVAPIDTLMDLLVDNLKADEMEFFQLLYHMEFKETLRQIFNAEQRNVGHLSVLFSAQKCVQLLKTKFKFTFQKKDIYGLSATEYALKLNNKKIVKLLKN